MNKKINKNIKATDFETDLQEELKDPKFRKLYDMYGRQLHLAYTILRLRKKLGLTQQAFAKKLGMKQSNVARIESGSENPTLATLNKIAEKFDKKLEISFV
jgi:DNA-binding XRE family transcriptional regulator